MLRLEGGDCLDVLKGLADGSVDACVTDPPYGLSEQSPEDVAACLRAWLAGEVYRPSKRGFMGKGWDAWVPGPEVWREVFRVLKPGGHLLAFAGSRTHDLMGMAVRLAGFEIRDSIFWCYSSGFPKSKNISLSIDKGEGHPNRGRAIPTASREQVNGAPLTANPVAPYTARSPEGAAWSGWGTALKPAQEPIIVARKPLAGTLAANVLRHGTGGINVDGCRVGTDERTYTPKGIKPGHGHFVGSAWDGGEQGEKTVQGRWPPNVLLCHHPDCREEGGAWVCVEGCVTGAFPASGAAGTVRLNAETGREAISTRSHGARRPNQTGSVCNYGDSGSAARYYPQFQHGAADDLAPLLYCPKAARSEREAGCEGLPARTGAEVVEREEGSAGAQSPRAGAGRTAAEIHNHHTTVKPVAVMAWLCRLVTPPGGIVLDPFMGSGTTGVAALREGFGFIGIEREPDYLRIAEARILHWTGQAPDGAVAEVPKVGAQLSLFGR